MKENFSIRLAGASDIPLIVNLATKIWPITYKDILTPAQLAYMMEMIYSPASLQRQMKENGHQFIIVFDETKDLGFASYSPIMAKEVFKLHKIYVLTNQQGKGLGKGIVDWIIREIAVDGAHALRLNVNRFNKAKQFYEKLGFTVIGEEDIDIGNGYFMNDFIMEKQF